VNLDDEPNIRTAFVKRLVHALAGAFLFFGTIWVAETATRILLSITGGN